MKNKNIFSPILSVVLLSLFLPLTRATAEERIKETKVELGDYTDKKLNDAFTTFAKENKTTPILILVSNGTAGKAKFAQKCVYDREKKILFFLKRTTYQTISKPTTSYSWVVWRSVEPADLTEGIPWFSERLKAELSKPGEDGRTNLPIKYPNEPEIVQWP
jgi:hypothetical protein